MGGILCNMDSINTHNLFVRLKDHEKATNDHIVRLENAIAELADRVYRLECGKPVKEDDDDNDDDDDDCDDAVHCMVIGGQVYRRIGSLMGDE